MKKEIKKGEIQQDQKFYLNDKKITELLSSTLADAENKFMITESTTDDIVTNADDNYKQYIEKFKKSLEFKIPPIEPIGQTVITSAMLMNLLEESKHLIFHEFDSSLIEEFKSTVSEIQIVVAKGPDCRQVQIGDKVKINMSDFYRIKNPNSVQSQEVSEIPLEIIDDTKYLSIHERNIAYIYRDEPVST